MNLTKFKAAGERFVLEAASQVDTKTLRLPRSWRLISLFLLVAIIIVAWARGGLLDLPRVPRHVTAASAGLADLANEGELDRAARQAIESERNSGLNPAQRLEQIRDRVRKTPDSLALGNAYRLEVFRMRRDFLKDARARGELMPKFPDYLERQPIAFLDEIVRERPSREARLQLALAWVDEMLLFPALEIKAPSSVQAVDILTEILEQPGNEYYVPALFARGLNHLHRPSRLVWPETHKTPLDAAVRDIAQCVAVGRKLGVGSARLQATLAMTLGDAYVKAGRLSVARSWWQIAQNLSHDDQTQQAVRRRHGWNDEEILDRLEEELDRARMELDQPMTDLAMMWN